MSLTKDTLKNNYLTFLENVFFFSFLIVSSYSSYVGQASHEFLVLPYLSSDGTRHDPHPQPKGYFTALWTKDEKQQTNQETGRRDGWAVKGLADLAEDPHLVPSILFSGFQLPVIPTPGDLILFFWPLRSHIHVHKPTSRTYIIRNNNKY